MRSDREIGECALPRDQIAVLLGSLADDGQYGAQRFTAPAAPCSCPGRPPTEHR